MSQQLHMALFAFLACCAAAPSQERLRNAPAASVTAHADDVRAIQRKQAEYVKAFNAGNAPSAASFWTADGEFVDSHGTFRGRADIEKELAVFFREAKGAALEIHPESLRFVGADVALESGRTRLTLAEAPPRSGAYSIVHVKRDGQWLLASVRSTPQAPAAYDALHELEWLVGTWSAKSGGNVLELTCVWTAQRHFLKRTYALKDADGHTRSGVQLIGWDPAHGQIRSWIFDSEGGIGSEWWSREGKRWLLEAEGTTRDGEQTAALNILTPLDHDTFTWQSVQRVLNDVRLPDTAIIRVTRVK
jgi:uncharacterized protein (TIGR02246 family)